MDNQPLDEGVETITKRKPKPVGGATSMLVSGILSILLFAGIFGILLAIVTLMKTKVARDNISKYPVLYTASSIKRVNAARICALTSLGLFGTGVLTVFVLYGLGIIKG